MIVWARTALFMLLVVLGACGGSGGQPDGSHASPTDDPAATGDAFCRFLDQQTTLLAGEVAEAYHGAQAGNLDGAITVSNEIVLPALSAMAEELDTIETSDAGRPFAMHARPLVREFSDAAAEFVEHPTADTFARTDVAGQVLRDEVFAGEVARVGVDVFQADCG